MPQQLDKLDLERCPYCGVAKPNLSLTSALITHAHSGGNPRSWKSYICASCGGVVLTEARGQTQGLVIDRIYPEARQVSEHVPDRARSYLNQAIGSLGAPSGAIMLAASAVDAMLKAKEFESGSLKQRIDAAAEAHLITQDMAQWAHAVRLDANEERHADKDSALPTEDQARHTLDFSLALAEFLFVLPERVKAGRRAAENPTSAPETTA
jgi:DNA-directed RNA polymerase subunit RPC12/RpoP